MKIEQIYKWLYRDKTDFSVQFNEKVIKDADHFYSSWIATDDGLTSHLGRCLAQFYCQAALKYRYNLIMMELCSAAVLPFLIVYWFFKGFLCKPLIKEKCDGVKFIAGHDIAAFEVPAELSCMDVRLSNRKVGYFRLFNLRLVIRLILLTFSDRVNKYRFQFLLKILYNLSVINPIFDLYDISFCCVFMEYNFASSLVTWYMNSRGVLSYNVMHGEKLYYCRDTFSYFNRFYAWHSFYVDLLKKLQCSAGEFKIFTPERFALGLSHGVNTGIGILFPSNFHPQNEMAKYIAMITRLSNGHRTVSVRYHPRYDVLFRKNRERIPDRIRISDPTQEPLREFLEKNEIIISHYSTVLIEAAMNGRNVIYIRDNYLESFLSYYFIFQYDHVKVYSSEQVTTGVVDTICSVPPKI
jgi:hypothetical protein